jgi:hypothetical protein
LTKSFSTVNDAFVWRVGEPANWRFERGEIVPERLTSTESDAFVRFAVEVLRAEYPQLTTFPERGKDGGIDFAGESEGGWIFGEAKLVGRDEVSVVRARWRETAKRLKRNLTSDGPLNGQAQYKPWYSHRVCEYLFVTSAALANLENHEEIAREIRATLIDLASTSKHLEHLRDARIRVIDWRELSERASAPSRFHWFVRSRSPGFVPIDSVRDGGTFREYLNSDRLPYYSVTGHGSSHQLTMSVDDEAQLLELLDSPSTTGVVIAGSGGAGKTRMTREIGLLAHDASWIVLDAQARCSASDLELLARMLAPKDRVLLLFDYLEVRPAFADLAELIEFWNVSMNLRIRYVANCRTSYLPRTAILRNHHVVDLSPVETSPSYEWRQRFRESIVRHILATAGLDTPEHRAVARDWPILAVFIAYLASSGRQTDLNDLLGQGDFGTWVARRVERAFSEARVARDLATVCLQFPIDGDAARAMSAGRYGPVIDKLAADGWIERVEDQSNYAWRSVHDVLIDQIVSSYAAGIPRTIEEFALEALGLGARCANVGATIVALQRLADLPHFAGVRWVRVFSHAIAANPREFGRARELVLRSPLLSAADVVDLLEQDASAFEGLELDPSGRLALSAIALRALQSAQPLTQHQRKVLETRLERAIDAEEIGTRVLAVSVSFNPSRFIDRALARLEKIVEPVPQTDGLLTALLEAGVDPGKVAPYVQQWLERFGLEPSASFLLKSWLRRGGVHAAVRGVVVAQDREGVPFVAEAWLAGGGDPSLLDEQIRDACAADPPRESDSYLYVAWLRVSRDAQLVREGVVRWLAAYGTSPAGAFLLRSWLEKTSETQSVAESVGVYLERNVARDDARIVLRAWLDAGGGTEFVQGFVKKWLDTHARSREARSIYYAWLRAGGDPIVIASELRAWLESHPTDAVAGYVIAEWLHAKGPDDLRPYVRAWLTVHADAPEAQHVFASWLKAGGDYVEIRPLVRRWLAKHIGREVAPYVYRPWIASGGDRELIIEVALASLKESLALPPGAHVLRALLESGVDGQIVFRYARPWIREFGLEAEAEFFFAAWLDMACETAKIRAILDQWLHLHARSDGAYFVYRAWLRAGGNLRAIRGHVLEWLTIHAEMPGAGALIAAWLRRSNDGVVLVPMRRWLNANRSNPYAQQVYAGFLATGGAPTDIEQDVKEWLHRHSNRPDARFVYHAWLRHGGDPVLIRDALLGWLRNHGAEPHARVVLGAWITATREHDLVRDPITVWLREHGSRADARTLYVGLLYAGSMNEIVAQRLPAWIELHGAGEGAGAVYLAWVRTDCDLNTIALHVRAWLELHAGSSTGFDLCRSWLKRGDASAVIEPLQTWLASSQDPPKEANVVQALIRASTASALSDTTVAWLGQNRGLRETALVLEAWLERKGDPLLVREDVNAWLAVHGSSRLAPRVMTAWLSAHGDKELVRDVMAARTDAEMRSRRSGSLYRAWLDEDGDPEAIRNLVRAWLHTNPSDPDLPLVLSAWLRAGGDLATAADGATQLLQTDTRRHNALFFYVSWLQREGDSAFVSEAALSWALENGGQRQAWKLYRIWMRSGLDPDAIAGPLTTWLERYAALAEARAVYRAWLKTKGDIEYVRPRLSEWLEMHAALPDAAYLWEAWLDAGGDIEYARPFVALWLLEHPTRPDAARIFKGWLRAGGEPSFIEAALTRWAAVADNSYELYQATREAWIAAGADPSRFDQQCPTTQRPAQLRTN